TPGPTCAKRPPRLAFTCLGRPDTTANRTGTGATGIARVTRPANSSRASPGSRPCRARGSRPPVCAWCRCTGNWWPTACDDRGGVALPRKRLVAGRRGPSLLRLAAQHVGYFLLGAGRLRLVLFE